MKFYFEKPVSIGFLLTIAILVILGLFSFSSTQRLINTWFLLNHRLSVVNTCEQVIKNIVDMETGERGYIITGEESFLEPFHHSFAPIKSSMIRLDSLTEGNSHQTKRVDTLRLLISQKTEWTQKVIAIRKENFEEAIKLVKQGNGKKLTDEIRNCVKSIQNEEMAIFKKNNTISGRNLLQFQYSLIAFATVIMIVIFYLFYLINKTLRARNQTEIALNKTATETRDLYNNAPCGYLSVDSSICITNINQTLLDWLNYNEQEVVGKMKFEDLLAPGSKAAYIDSFTRDFDKYKTLGYVNNLEFDFIRKNKTSFPVNLNSTAVFNSKGEFVRSRSTVFDNTERKEAENKILQLNQELESKVEERTRKLLESQRIYKSIASNIPGSAITIIDREERYIVAEGDLLEQMGFKKEQMLHSKLVDLLAPERYTVYQSLVQRALQGETIIKEVKTPSGQDVVMRVVPLNDDHENYFAVMFVLIDISEIKKAQLELTEINSTLEKNVAQRTVQLQEVNQELESFTYTVSHDLRAPIRIISGYTDLMKEDYYDKLDAEGQRILVRIIKNTERMGTLIDDLLNFSRYGRAELSIKEVDMDALAREVMQELSAFEKDRKINSMIHSLPPAEVDDSLIRQVWVNLIANALKYSQKKTTTDIEIGSYKEEDDTCYYVKDNGAGFDMAYADKLFRVFQRLHTMSEFDGTGVGLALVHRIIKRHGGRVWAQGEINAGATFYFSLPSHSK